MSEVTLTNAERALLDEAEWVMDDGAHRDAVEQIIAARLAEQREQIAKEIEAQPFDYDMEEDCYSNAARIIRGVQ